MSADEKIHYSGKKRTIHTILSIALIAVAVALLVYMVSVEGELGALPLFLLLCGIAWLVVALRWMRPRNN